MTRGRKRLPGGEFLESVNSQGRELPEGKLPVEGNVYTGGRFK